MSAPDQALEPLLRWHEETAAARIPHSARDYVPELFTELREAAEAGTSADEVARRLRGASGPDRRARALRILERVGAVDRGLTAFEETQRRIATLGGGGR
ncbi:MAG: hypothetical protein M3N57_13135 [Actinomycetota bacterium]|nr:hypothetical protein [Actinomycetota bacterium]